MCVCCGRLWDEHAMEMDPASCVPRSAVLAALPPTPAIVIIIIVIAGHPIRVPVHDRVPASDRQQPNPRLRHSGSVETLTHSASLLKQRFVICSRSLFLFITSHTREDALDKHPWPLLAGRCALCGANGFSADVVETCCAATILLWPGALQHGTLYTLYTLISEHGAPWRHLVITESQARLLALASTAIH